MPWNNAWNGIHWAVPLQLEENYVFVLLLSLLCQSPKGWLGVQSHILIIYILGCLTLHILSTARYVQRRTYLLVLVLSVDCHSVINHSSGLVVEYMLWWSQSKGSSGFSMLWQSQSKRVFWFQCVVAVPLQCVFPYAELCNMAYRMLLFHYSLAPYGSGKDMQACHWLACLFFIPGVGIVV